MQRHIGLVVPEEFDTHPAPQVEEDVHWDSDREQQAVETHAVPTGAALREVLIHCSRVKQATQGQERNQTNQQRQGNHGYKVQVCLFNNF